MSAETPIWTPSPLRIADANLTRFGAFVRERGAKAPLVVYTIVKRERDGRAFWVRIGNAFRNHDGSLNALLDAVPTNGTLHIREQRPFEARPDPAANEASGAFGPAE